MMKLAVVLMATGLLLAGCGGSDEPDDPQVTAQAEASPSDSPSPAKTERETTLTASSSAEDVIAALKDSGLPISDVTIYTKASDPNDQMGQPGAYTSKGAFVDDRVDAGDVKDSSHGSIDLGGGVEVFDGQDRAEGRAHYIEQAIISTGGLVAAENDIVAGGILLRLSGYLSDSAVHEYQDALSALTGQPADLVVKA
jgi:hypothetical protein